MTDPTNPADLARTIRSMRTRLTRLQRSRRIPPPVAKSATSSGTITPSGSWGGSSPSLDFYVPPSGRVLITVQSQTMGAGPSQLGLGYSMAGANVGDVLDNFLQQYVWATGTPRHPMFRHHVAEGLNPGLTSFTVKTIRTSGSATLNGDATSIVVVGL